MRTHRSPRLLQARHPARTPPRTRVGETALDLAQQSADLDEALGLAEPGVRPQAYHRADAARGAGRLATDALAD
ncbi:MAG: hypothetical protein ABJB47_07860 [Actinomycetota bacterium]